MSISMHIQNLDKLYKSVLKILSRNKIMTDGRTDGMTDNPNYSTPLFQTRAIMKVMSIGKGNILQYF